MEIFDFKKNPMFTADADRAATLSGRLPAERGPQVSALYANLPSAAIHYVFPAVLRQTGSSRLRQASREGRRCNKEGLPTDRPTGLLLVQSVGGFSR